MWYVIIAVVSYFFGCLCATRHDEKRFDEQLKAGTVVHKGVSYRVERWRNANEQ